MACQLWQAGLKELFESLRPQTAGGRGVFRNKKRGGMKKEKVVRKGERTALHGKARGNFT